jgi:hypothetical protein
MFFNGITGSFNSVPHLQNAGKLGLTCLLQLVELTVQIERFYKSLNIKATPSS